MSKTNNMGTPSAAIYYILHSNLLYTISHCHHGLLKSLNRGCFPVLTHLMFPPNGELLVHMADQPLTYSLFCEATFFRSEAVTFCFKGD